MSEKTKQAVNFQSLKIERQRWGKNEGKLVAELEIKGDKSTVTLVLPDVVADQILHLAKTAIIDGVEKSANDFIFELTTQIPDTLCLDEGSRP